MVQSTIDLTTASPAVPAADPLGARLAAAAALLPKGALDAARDAARGRVTAMGLPRGRDEYWRYTDPAALNAAEPAAVSLPADLADSRLYDGLDQLRLVFVDGRFDAAASDDLAESGIEIATLAALPAHHWAADLYGTLEARGQSPVARPFAALNTAVAADGAVLRVTGAVARPVHIVHRRRAADADPVVHHLVRVEPGASLTLLETGMLGARSNTVIEADLAPGATLNLIASKRAERQKVAIGHIFARVAAEAVFKAFTLSVNGTLMRHEAVVEIAGDDAVAHVAGAVLGDGADGPFHHDDTVFVTHAAERCESRQVFKKVLKNGAVGVFQGKILVQPGAQKTDGYQISQALLLDEASQFLAKPELEIYADDVRCSHGSTTGALDETTLYYLRSRGVPKDRAVVLLVLSFLADALAEIGDDEIRARITARLEDWLIEHGKVA